MLEVIIGVIVFLLGVAFGVTLKGDINITKRIIHEEIRAPEIEAEEAPEEEEEEEEERLPITGIFETVDKIIQGEEEIE